METEIPVTVSATAHLNGRHPVRIMARWESMPPAIEPYIWLLFGEQTGATAVSVTLSLEQARELRHLLSTAIEEGVQALDLCPLCGGDHDRISRSDCPANVISLDEAVQRG